MSLVGSLEDLGLGDILQIVSLSRKSGLLLIHSDEGEGRIVFFDGLVRAAFVKGEPEDLRGLLVTTGFVAEPDFQRAVELAEARGEPLDTVVPECTGLTKERLDSLRREHVERAVFRIFSWRGGEFSFEVREAIDERDSEILLPMGINAQFLTMEATRLGDEGERDASDDAGDEQPMFSGEEISTGGFPNTDSQVVASFVDSADAEPPESVPLVDDGDTLVDAQVESAFAAADEDEAVAADPDPPSNAHEVVALAAAHSEAPEFEDEEPVPHPTPVVTIEPQLTTLEWQKSLLKGAFSRVHAFQDPERGVERIRQYLGRGQKPIVIVSAELGAEPALGTEGVEDFVERLKQQASSMRVLVALEAGDDTVVPGSDGAVELPDPALIANRNAWSRLEDAAETFRGQVRAALVPDPAPPRTTEAPSAPGAGGAHGLQRLRRVSELMRAPEKRGEALSLVLDFAAESFPRVAMFMVRDDVAVGMAQHGLEAAGGPDAEAFSDIEVPTGEVEWFHDVLAERTARSSPPRGEGDRQLAMRLGTQVAREAYVAPIESGGRVVALLYADRLPSAEPIGDTTIMEIVLHEAGLALERALLERALERATESAEG